MYVKSYVPQLGSVHPEWVRINKSAFLRPAWSSVIPSSIRTLVSMLNLKKYLIKIICFNLHKEFQIPFNFKYFLVILHNSIFFLTEQAN